MKGGGNLMKNKIHFEVKNVFFPSMRHLNDCSHQRGAMSLRRYIVEIKSYEEVDNVHFLKTLDLDTVYWQHEQYFYNLAYEVDLKTE